jgi:hypothetical protein
LEAGIEVAQHLFSMILEFVVSLFLEERHRSRTRDEHWRERQLLELENLVDSHRRLAAEFSSTHGLSSNDKLWVLDRKIEERSARLAGLIANDESTQAERNEQYMKLLDLCEELQIHVNTLINQSFK